MTNVRARNLRCHATEIWKREREGEKETEDDAGRSTVYRKHRRRESSTCGLGRAECASRNFSTPVRARRYPVLTHALSSRQPQACPINSRRKWPYPSCGRFSLSRLDARSSRLASMDLSASVPICRVSSLERLLARERRSHLRRRKEPTCL